MNRRCGRLSPANGATGFGNPRKKETIFLLLDGSIKIITNDIDPKVLKALSTPAGGEAIPD